MDWKLAPGCQVNLPSPKPANEIPWRITAAVIAWVVEHGGVDGAATRILRSVEIDRLTWHNIQIAEVLTASRGISEEISVKRYGKPRSDHQPPIQPPVIQQNLCKLISAHVGQIPTHAALQIVAHVNIAVPSGDGQSKVVGAKIKTMRPGIRCHSLHTMTYGALELRL